MTEPKFKIYQTVYTFYYVFYCGRGSTCLLERKISCITHDGANFNYHLGSPCDRLFGESEIFTSKQEAISNEIAKLECRITELKLELEQMDLKEAKNDREQI